MSDKTLLKWIVVFALAMVTFQVLFKKAVEADEVDKLKQQFSFRSSYHYEYAPDFRVIDLEGNVFQLSEHVGTNVVVLNFFATWCGPCREEMDEFVYFLEKTTSQPVTFLAIGVGEDDAAIKAFLEAENASLPAAADPDKRIAARYRIRGFPTTVVIGPDGRIRVYEVGMIRNADVSLIPQVRQAAMLAEHGAAEHWRQTYSDHAPSRLPKSGADADDAEAKPASAAADAVPAATNALDSTGKAEADDA